MGEDMSEENRTLFYTLHEVAQEWSVSRQQLLRMAIAGELTVCLWLARAKYKGLARIHIDDLRKFLIKKRVYIKSCFDDDGNEIVLSIGSFLIPIGGSTENLPGYHEVDELCISPTEYSRLKARFPRKEHTGTLEPAANGKDEIMAALDCEWNTCKVWMKKYGITGPPWCLPWSVSIKIKTARKK